MGSHAFFVRSDLLHEEDVNMPLRFVKKNSHPPDPKQRDFVDVLYDFIPVIGASPFSLAAGFGHRHGAITLPGEEAGQRKGQGEETKSIQRKAGEEAKQVQREGQREKGKEREKGAHVLACLAAFDLQPEQHE
eukprot:g11219.t1